MKTEILPFKPVVEHFMRNLWYLRFFLLLFILAILVSSTILFFVQGSNLAPRAEKIILWLQALGITMKGVFLGNSTGYIPTTILGEAISIFNSLLGYLLLGILIWVVEQSLTGHSLTKSRYMFFPKE